MRNILTLHYLTLILLHIVVLITFDVIINHGKYYRHDTIKLHYKSQYDYCRTQNGECSAGLEN